MKCRICGNEDTHEEYSVKEMMFGTHEMFDYFKCNNCGCLQIKSFPKDMTKYYPKNYYSKSEDEPTNSTTWLERFFQKQQSNYTLFGRGYKLNKLLKYFVEPPQALTSCRPIIKRSGVKSFSTRFLDVGCGSQAWWLKGLRDLGFSKLVGIDPFIEFDIKDGPVSIWKREIWDVSDKFDCITFHHSFEHMLEPVKVLSKAKQLLSPGGTCIIRIPLVSSYAWEKYGTSWVELDAPRHFFLHSTKSFTMLATQCGFEITDTVYDGNILELLGSEQYLKGIPHTAENSYFVNPDKSEFQPEEIKEFKNKVKKLNDQGRSGRAQFYLKHSQK